jgi:lysophospholipase L1-like esterase
LMQGFLLADDQTPPARLQAALGGPGLCSVLNVGVLGYSPAQYYHSVVEYAPRFAPHAVVVSLCCNDVDPRDAEDVARQRRWLAATVATCADRQIPCLVVATPDATRYLGERDRRPYPECLRDGVPAPARWLDLTPAFRAAEPDVTTWEHSGLFFSRLLDGHMSPKGADLWAHEVARELGDMLERKSDD